MLQEEAYRLFESEIQHWELARSKYEEMTKGDYKSFSFGDFSIEVVCNPARIRSTAAAVNSIMEKMRKTDAPFLIRPSNNEHTCFLCSDIRPKEQHAIRVRDFDLLVNPYPIFPIHFTIAHIKHQKQEILPYFDDYLYFVRELPNFGVFFNGANCGASAPFHIHFQAAEKQNFSIIGDFENMNKEHFQIVKTTDNCRIVEIKNYLRKAFCIEGSKEEEIKNLFADFFKENIAQNMLNIISHYDNGVYKVFIFPRKKFRPTQFYEKDMTKNLCISPASVEMSGRIVTIFPEHFNRLTKEDIVDIYNQIS